MKVRFAISCSTPALIDWYKGFEFLYKGEFTLVDYVFNNQQLEMTAIFSPYSSMRIRSGKDKLITILEGIADPDEDGNYPYEGKCVIGHLVEIISIN